MNTTQLMPWNWFKREDNLARNVPGHMHRRGTAPAVPLYMELDKLFDSFFNGFPGTQFSGGLDKQIEQAICRPNLDISGDDKAYHITVELPGVDEKDVHVELNNDTLSIHGEKKLEKEEGEKSGKGFYRVERSYGSFNRTLVVPKDVDTSAIKAEHKDGILTITLPRREAALQESKKIAINE